MSLRSKGFYLNQDFLFLSNNAAEMTINRNTNITSEANASVEPVWYF